VLGHLFLVLAAAFAAGFFGQQRDAPVALASYGLLLVVFLAKIELLVVLLLLGPAGTADAAPVPVAERDLVLLLLLLALLLTRCVLRQYAL
jgi:hypothetical protein